jgi:hypothetical protein
MLSGKDHSVCKSRKPPSANNAAKCGQICAQ